MRTLTELLTATEELLGGLEGTPIPQRGPFRTGVEELRDEVELLALGGDHGEAPGLLNDSLTSLLLSLRAAERMDAEQAEEYLEQAGLFLAAAQQSVE